MDASVNRVFSYTFNGHIVPWAWPKICGLLRQPLAKLKPMPVPSIHITFIERRRKGLPKVPASFTFGPYLKVEVGPGHLSGDSDSEELVTFTLDSEQEEIQDCLAINEGDGWQLLEGGLEDDGPRYWVAFHVNPAISQLDAASLLPRRVYLPLLVSKSI
jgi:hypothetical protein